MRRASCLATLALAACTPELDDQGLVFEEADPQQQLVAAYSYGGCGDVDLYAHGPRDQHAVFLGASNLATEAHQAGTTIVRTYQLPSNEIFVRAEVGRRLTSATCVGAFPQPGPRVDNQWIGIAGQVQIRVTPDPNGSVSLPFATADARMRNLELVDASGAVLTLPRIVMTGVGVGFYPP